MLCDLLTNPGEKRYRTCLGIMYFNPNKMSDVILASTVFGISCVLFCCTIILLPFWPVGRIYLWFTELYEKES